MTRISLSLLSKKVSRVSKKLILKSITNLEFFSYDFTNFFKVPHSARASRTRFLCFVVFISVVVIFIFIVVVSVVIRIVVISVVVICMLLLSLVLLL